jgi:hypothetical protein
VVEDRITDGRRIAQLLASELDGRADGALAHVAVVNADPEADPTPDGTRAYDVAVDGTTVASVNVYPDRARITMSATAGADVERAIEDAETRGLHAERVSDPNGAAIVVDDGAAVKRAVATVAAATDAEKSRETG